jgi:hypothetical protein
MEAMRKSWTDERLDEGLGRVEEGVWSLQRSISNGFIAMTSAVIAGFAAIVALMATQL